MIWYRSLKLEGKRFFSRERVFLGSFESDFLTIFRYSFQKACLKADPII